MDILTRNPPYSGLVTLPIFRSPKSVFQTHPLYNVYRGWVIFSIFPPPL